MGKFLLIACLCFLGFTQYGHSLSLSTLAACKGCHGQEGISSNPKYPNLAGQHEGYFIKQLKDMKNHRLYCPSKMRSQLLLLDEKDLSELAQHYANMPILKQKKKIKCNPRGKMIYTVGDYEKKITACIICHGPRGRGNAEVGFPVLAGQSTHYIQKQLIAFKQGRRTTDLNRVMQTLCSQMSLDDIQAIAHYIEHF